MAISRRSFIISGGVGLAVAGDVKAQAKGPKPVENCPFCKIVAGKLSAFNLWENKHFLAFLDHKPISPGHTLVIPKLHYPYLFDMPDKQYGEIMSVSRRLAAPIRSAMGSKRIGVLVEGFGVDHSHVHLVPINGSNELTRKGVSGVTDEEFGRVAGLIKSAIARI
ncbi:MAG TPA: HIT family protein [Pyrinomonadaceae bacterium]|nr:HIT family protein [Pyrinomonadaceae bacterium]